MILCDRKLMIFIYSFILYTTCPSIQANTFPLICSANDSVDYFEVYPSQLIYSSDSFTHYQLIAGLTVLVVNNQTLRFNRLSNFNLLSRSALDPNKPPSHYQFFSGVCKYKASNPQTKSVR